MPLTPGQSLLHRAGQGIPTRPRELFSQDRTGYDLTGARQHDVAPDGRRFLVTKNVVEADHVPSLIFVENWIEEFRENN